MRSWCLHKNPQGLTPKSICWYMWCRGGCRGRSHEHLVCLCSLRWKVIDWNFWWYKCKVYWYCWFTCMFFLSVRWAIQKSVIRNLNLQALIPTFPCQVKVSVVLCCDLIIPFFVFLPAFPLQQIQASCFALRILSLFFPTFPFKSKNVL